MTRGPRKGTGGRPPATDRATVRTTRVETHVNADELAALERHRRQGETRGALVRRLALVGAEVVPRASREGGLCPACGKAVHRRALDDSWACSDRACIYAHGPAADDAEAWADYRASGGEG